MINQFLFLLYIAILGVSFMFFFKNSLSSANLYLLSVPTGLSIWVFQLIILFILGLPFEKLFIGILSLLLLSVFIAIHRNKFFVKKNLVQIIIYLALYSGFSFLFLIFNYSFFTNDSWRMLIGGKYIATYGSLLDSLIDQRGLYAYIIHSSSNIFGFDYLYALYPLMMLFFALFFAYNLYSPLSPENKEVGRNILFSSLVVLFILSTFFVLLNAFYVHSNLLSGIYGFLALFGLWKHLVSKDRNWLIISAIAILSFSFLRIEGPLLSLIIIIILISIKQIKFKEKVYYVGAVSLFVVVWHIRLFFMLAGHTSKYYMNPARTLLITVLYTLIFTVLLVSQKGILNRIKEYFPLLMVYSLSIGWTILIFTEGPKTKGNLLVLKKYGRLILNSVKHGDWGITWIVLGILFAVALILKKLRHESLFLYYIFSFALLFNSIHLYRGGWRIGWGDSGNRMLMSIIFVISFYVFLKFRNVLFPNSLEK